MRTLRSVLALGTILVLGSCTYLPKNGACPETAQWTAWIDAMPGPNAERSLIVTGRAFVPVDRVAILRAGPTDRMNPPGQRFTLFLFLDPDAEEGWQDVRAEVTPALPEYREIVVSCAGEELARIENIQTAY